MATTMRGFDTIRGNMASCMLVLGNGAARVNFMQASEVVCEIEYDQKEVYALGATMKQFHNSIATGTGSGTFSFNTAIFQRMAQDFKNDFRNVYWELEMTVNDPDSEAHGMQFVAKQCLCTKNLLAKFMSNGDLLESDLDFTFSDFEFKTMFSPLTGSQEVGAATTSGGGGLDALVSGSLTGPLSNI